MNSKRMATNSLVLNFLLLTFGISIVSFLLMIFVPNAQSPESLSGLPVWLIAIWSPNISAIILWINKKMLAIQLKNAFNFPDLSIWILIILLPVIIAGTLILFHTIKGEIIVWSNFKIKYILPLIFINLIMGPLGEELGWRGFLFPIIKQNYGWLGSAIFVGIIWAIWHGPLWFIDSPQSKIPFWAFSVTVICLSILMSIVHNNSGGSIIPVVLFHLIFNVSLGIVDILETHHPGEYVTKSLWLYIPSTILLVGLHEIFKQSCVTNY